MEMKSFPDMEIVGRAKRYDRQVCEKPDSPSALP